AEDISPHATVDEEEEEEEEDEVLVEEDQVPGSESEDDLDEDAAVGDVTSHPDADTTIIFGTGEVFPANETGSQDFTVHSLEASFRYPQDSQFYIQNVSLGSGTHDGNGFQMAIYNQTVTIVELEEGLEGETMFMYIFLTGLALAIFGVYQVLESRTKRLPVKVETGTGGMNDVDISWIPQETLNIMSKASASPKASPRKRTKRAAGVDQ
uniref:Translocon-associated protein subunit alpha n=1 Tax=Salmo trutta TaxID=8032 RepID=A0A674DAG2_SALTR